MAAQTNTLAEELEQMIEGDGSVRTTNAILFSSKELMPEALEIAPFLSIWQPGLDTLNVLVANFLNLSIPLLGRGVSKEMLELCLSNSVCVEPQIDLSQEVSDTQRAVRGFANSFLTSSQVDTPENLRRSLSKTQVECLVLAIGLNGFVSKVRDAIGYADADSKRKALGQNDLATYLRNVWVVPGAHKLKKRLVKGVSSGIGSASIMLEASTGYSWPILGSLHQRQAARALAVALSKNLHSESSKIGIETKCLSALVYAHVVADPVLIAESIQLAKLLVPDMSQRKLQSIVRFAKADMDSLTLSSSLSPSEAAAVILARAASPRPCELNEISVSTVSSELTPAQIVEVITWLAMQELLGRLYKFYRRDF